MWETATSINLKPARRSPSPHRLLHLTPRNRVFVGIAIDASLSNILEVRKEVVEDPCNLVQVRLLLVNEPAWIEVLHTGVALIGNGIGGR